MIREKTQKVFFARWTGRFFLYVIVYLKFSTFFKSLLVKHKCLLAFVKTIVLTGFESSNKTPA
jgi:hypothetical protein